MAKSLSPPDSQDSNVGNSAAIRSNAGDKSKETDKAAGIGRVLGLATLLAFVPVLGCGDSESPVDPTPPASLSGTWSGTETATAVPYDWEFVIRDTNGSLTGSYDSSGGDGAFTGRFSPQNGSVQITMSGDLPGTFSGSAAVTGGRVNSIAGNISYRIFGSTLGPYQLTLTPAP